MNNKIILRKEYKDIRKRVINKNSKSEIICQKLIKMDKYKKANVIGVYCNLSDEVNTELIINNIINSNKIAAIPRVINDTDMEFYYIKSINEINTISSYGIKEPTGNFNRLVKKIDLLIIPGICFDLEKNRIGFGKGYYDNYIKKYNCSCNIGICFDEQLLINGTIEVSLNDIKMDMIITDERIIE